jgi:hypothetical protein
VNAVMNLRVPKMRGMSSLAANRLASQGLCSMEYGVSMLSKVKLYLNLQTTNFT